MAKRGRKKLTVKGAHLGMKHHGKKHGKSTAEGRRSNWAHFLQQ